MSPLLRDDDLVRIDLPAEGEWVEVKRRLSRGDEIAVQGAAVRGAKVRPGDFDVELDAAAAIEGAEFAALERAIKRWSFDVPLTPAALRDLDGESVDVIKARLDELYAPRTDDERKNSDGATPTLSSGKGPPSPTNSAG